jgi:hypothetical protein
MQAVKRKLSRFPEDFMFRSEIAIGGFGHDAGAGCQAGFVTSSWGWYRHAPCAFTEQGVVMLSSVLRNLRAVRVNIEIMRAFGCPPHVERAQGTLPYIDGS